MVFGWGKKRKKVQVQGAQRSEARSITLTEIASIAEDARNVRSKTLISEILALRSQMTGLFADLEKIISKLDGDDLKIADVDRHVRIIVERGKKQVIKIAKEESSKPMPAVSEYGDVEKFVDESRRRIKRTGDALGRHSRVINLFAKKYADRIKNIMHDLESARKEAASLLEDGTAQNDAALAVKSGLTEIAELEKTLGLKKNRAAETEAEAEQTAKSIKEAEEKISGLKSGSEYAAYERSLEKLSSHDVRIQDARRKINEQFTKISRPLSKYEYVSALEKERKMVLRNMCSDPCLAIQKNSASDIQSVLSATRAGVTGGTVSVKDVQRSSDAIDEILVLVPEFASSLNALTVERAKITAQIADIFDAGALESLESHLSGKSRLLEDQKTRAASMREESESASRKIPQVLEQIEQNLHTVTGIAYAVRS